MPNVGRHTSYTNGFIPIVLEGRFVGELAHVAPHRNDRILAVLPAIAVQSASTKRRRRQVPTEWSRVAQFFAGLVPTESVAVQRTAA